MMFARNDSFGAGLRPRVRGPQRSALKLNLKVESLEVRSLLSGMSGMDMDTGMSAMAMPSGSDPEAPPPPLQFQTGQPFRDPPQVVSHHHVLKTTLVATEQGVQIAGQRVVGRVYNGSYTAPTLRVQPGDKMIVTLVNHLDEPTNLHFHGLHVSPNGHSDNIFLEIAPGKSFRYVVKIPKNHPAGTYWYHSHDMMDGEAQVFGGLSGAIVVDGLKTLLPPSLRHVTEHTFDLKDFQVDSRGEIVKTDIDSDAPTNRTVNGQVDPVLTMKPGETQLWHLANIGADIFYDLHLDGNVFHVIGEDGNPVDQAWTAGDLVLPPGKRYDVLVQAGAPGVSQLRTLAYSTGPEGDSYPEDVLTTILTTGTPQQPAALPTAIKPFHDLRTDPIAASRTLFLSENPNTDSQFYIDGQAYDPNRTDIVVHLNTTEEWTVVNLTGEQHPFHLHTDPFQVISINGKPVNAHSYVDTQIVPAGGQIKFRVHFSDYKGKTVYHCHIMHHEENGMMGNIDIV